MNSILKSSVSLFILAMGFYSLQAQQDIKHPTSGTQQFCVTAGAKVLYYDDGGSYCDRIVFPGGDYSRNINNSKAVICPDDPNSAITIEFLEVDIETRFSGGACWDEISIYNGNSTNSPLLFSGCGEDGFDLCPNGQPGDNGDANNNDGGPNDMNGSLSNNPANYLFTSTSSDGCLTVAFSSDNTDEDGGWLAEVTASGANGPSCGDGVISDGCANGNLLRLVMYGDFGSGWGQGEMTITNKETEEVVVTTGLTAGSQDVEFYCLPDACYLIDVCGSFFPNDISWDIYVDGEEDPSYSGSGHVTDFEMPLNSVCETLCDDNLLELALNLDFLVEQTSWEITDDEGNTVASGDNYSCTVNNEKICLPDGCYDFSILDSGGDGICCNFGNGDYTLTDEDGTILATGSEFGSIETTQFTIGAGVCSPVPSPWSTTDLGSDCNDYDYDDQTDIFSLTGCGNNAISTTSDNIAFINQSACGDVEIVAKVESVSSNGYGGITIREGLNTGDKQVSIFSNLTNSLRHETRYLSNANKVVQSFIKPSPIWLKLTRQGDWFFAYYSSNGMSFQYVHAVYVPMSNCVEIGLAGFTYVVGQNTVATFSNVSITGGQPQPISGNQGIADAVNGSSINNMIPSDRLLEVNVYPNPARELINIHFGRELSQEVTATIYNLQGKKMEQKLLQTGIATTQWPVHQLEAGSYYIVINQQGMPAQMLPFIIAR